tara:strand:- start:973 stop:1719 length:747 start_codon:yes stop_codon:yes gene_type:complete
MDVFQSILNSVLFCDKFGDYRDRPATTSGAAGTIHEAFWADAFNRNLRLDQVEIEVRLGKLPASKRGPFDTNIPRALFQQIVQSLQDYHGWDDRSHTRDMVGYFPEKDESLRLIVGEDGGCTAHSKQKLTQADFAGNSLPFDFRLAVNLELDLPTSNLNIEHATRVINRERNSFTLKNTRYDLTRITHLDGREEHQVELELLNLTETQLTHTNAQELTMEVQQRLVDILNACEPIRSFDISLIRKRHF